MDKWNATAANYAQHLHQHTLLFSMDAVKLVRPHGKVLDMACGSGALTQALISYKQKHSVELDIVATDFSKEMTDIVSSKYKVTTMIQDSRDLKGLQDNSFNVVYSMFGFCCVGDHISACESAYRVLVNKGTLIACMADKEKDFGKSYNGLALAMGKLMKEHKHSTSGHGKEHDSTTGHGKEHGEMKKLKLETFTDQLTKTGYKNVRTYVVAHTFVFETIQDLLNTLKTSNLSFPDEKVIPVLRDYVGTQEPIALPHYANMIIAEK